MDCNEIERLHAEHCGPNFGTTSPDELEYIQSLIVRHRPRTIIEIGTASGLTTGFIARFLSENGGTSVTSIDLDDRFFADKDKAVGYLAHKIYTGTDVEINIQTHKTSLDLSALDGPWDMAFIDADHQHPWPTLDTLAVAPFLRGPRVVVHHDLQLYRRYRRFRGIGPRVLFNEMPNRYRDVSEANGWNIFSLDLSIPVGSLEHVAIGALSMPWTAYPDLSTRKTAQWQDLLSRHYSDRMVAEFSDCAKMNRLALPRRLMMHFRMLRRRLF